MKIIKYKFLSCEVNYGTEDEPNIKQVFLEKAMPCKTQAEFDANYRIAEKEAVPGTLDPDLNGEFDPEPVSEPTAEEILNAMLGVSRYE